MSHTPWTAAQQELGKEEGPFSELPQDPESLVPAPPVCSVTSSFFSLVLLHAPNCFRLHRSLVPAMEATPASRCQVAETLRGPVFPSANSSSTWLRLGPLDTQNIHTRGFLGSCYQRKKGAPCTEQTPERTNSYNMWGCPLLCTFFS